MKSYFHSFICDNFLKASETYMKNFTLEGVTHIRSIMLYEFVESSTFNDKMDNASAEHLYAVNGAFTYKDCCALFAGHKAAKDYADVINRFNKGLLTPCTLLSERTIDKTVFIYDNFVYSISYNDGEVDREVMLYFNFPDKLQAPIEFCSSGESGEGIYSYCVKPYIPGEILDDSTLYDYLDLLPEYSYYTSNDDGYEPESGYEDYPYIVLPNGMRIEDAHCENFRFINKSLFIVDTAEVDL